MERGGVVLGGHPALVTVFGIAFAQWIRDGEGRSFADIAAEVLGELVNLTAAPAGAAVADAR